MQACRYAGVRAPKRLALQDAKCGAGEESPLLNHSASERTRRVPSLPGAPAPCMQLKGCAGYGMAASIATHTWALP